MSIILNNIYYNYRIDSYINKALEGVSLEAENGGFVCICGLPGAGKTTLIKIVCGILKPDSGRVSFGGARNAAMAYVPQYPEHMFFNRTVYEEIAFGPENAGLDRKNVDSRVRGAMEMAGLDFGVFSGRNPFSLSTGEMRKCAIAIAVSAGTGTIVADEPFAGLDGQGAEKIGDCFEKINRLGITVILALGPDDRCSSGARKILMKKGRIA